MKKMALVSFLMGMTFFLYISPVMAGTFYIDTPDLCSRVERIEAYRVYLDSKGNCPKSPGKVTITADEDAGEMEIYVNGEFWKRQKLGRFDIGSIGEVNERGDRLSRSLSIPRNPFEKEGDRRAKETSDLFRSGEFQQKVLAEQERLKREIFGGMLREYYQDSPGASSAIAGALPSNERIYIFISSSMPRETLRNYARDVAKLKDPNVKLVMRGLIGGVKYIKPTMRFVSGILLKDPACDPGKGRCERYAAGVNVDPLLFRRYGIREVPAIVYARGVSILDIEMSEGMERNAKAGDFYVIRGDVALGYALERFRSETGSSSMEAMIRDLNAGFYSGRKQQ